MKNKSVTRLAVAIDTLSVKELTTLFYRLLEIRDRASARGIQRFIKRKFKVDVV